MPNEYAVVGGLVGAVSDLTVGSARLVDAGRRYDFAVAGLGFRMCPTDTTPYQRSTAPFRKNQFDNTTTAGDQSLTGWWTRGQFSFHEGAGMKFYEVLDGQTVLNHYSDSNGVDVTKPGQVTLEPDLAPVLNAAPGDLKTVCSTLYGLAFIDGTTVKISNDTNFPVTPTTITLSGSVTAKAMAVNEDFVFVATSGNNIQKFSVLSPAPAVIYTHSTGIVNIWFAKQRLWVLDNTGQLFVVSGSPATPPVALSAPVTQFDTNISSVDEACLTASGEGVYMSLNNSAIYRFTLSNDGSVPILTAPVVAAELPYGENISAIRYYLGVMVIASMVGVRIAVDNNGALVYGPPIIDFAGTQSSTIAVRGTCAYVIGSPQGAQGTDQGQVAYAIDLANQISDLSFAWRVAYTMSTSNPPSFAGGVEMFGGNLLLWASNNLVSDHHYYVPGSPVGNLTSTGTLTTGYHRFGTLEPKRFHTVRVRYGGNGGAITVARVMADGSAVNLITLDPIADSATDITLGLPQPLEYIGLRFTLQRDALDATKGPTLLGYQLRALPAPRRQRLLKVPLEIQDTARGRFGPDRGHKGAAWEALAALEELESSTALVNFTDFRTGESGTAYVESVDFQADTPVQRNDASFGGVCYLTLRVVG